MAFKHYLEEEDDKPYFTTNSLGYYYDKMEGFAEKVEQAAKTLNVTKEEVEKNITAYIEQNKNELDQRLAQWDGKLETFDSSIENLLTEWVDDGTLTHVIDSTLIDQKIAPVTSQLADTTQQTESVKQFRENEVTARIQTQIKPAIVFVSDDGDILDYDESVKSIFKDNNIPCVVAAITGRIENNEPYTMTYAQMKDLQDNYGYEISSHSHTHLEMNTLTEAQLEFEMGESYRLLNANGLKTTTMCVPYGKYSNTVKKIGQKYYRGIRVSGASVNPTPLKNLEIVSFSTEFEDLAACKAKVDETLAKNTLTVFLFHAWSFRANPQNKQNLSDLVAYIKTKNLDVITLNDAVTRFGNAIDVGANSEFRVSQTGQIESKQITSIYLDRDAVGNATTLTGYKKDALSISPISTAGATGLPEGKAGLLLTYNFHSEVGYQFQEYHVMVSQNKYKRNILANGNWGLWKIMHTSDFKITSRQDLTPSHVPADLTENFINVATYNGLTGAGYPENKSGTLTAYALAYGTDKSWYHEEYKLHGSNTTYTRYALANGTWSPWVNPSDMGALQNVIIAGQNAFTATSLYTAFADNKITHCKITTGGAAGFPDNVGGLLVTSRLGGGDSGFNYQIYHKYNSNDTYKRFCNASGIWQTWVKYTAV